jgi:hypothetical protein
MELLSNVHLAYGQFLNKHKSSFERQDKGRAQNYFAARDITRAVASSGGTSAGTGVALVNPVVY